MTTLVQLLVPGNTFNATLKSEFQDIYVRPDSVTTLTNPTNAVALVYAGSMIYQILFTASTFATDVNAYKADFITRSNA